MNGTMKYACMGAYRAEGFVVGICPTKHREDMNSYIHVPIITSMGEGRNFINVLSSHAVIAIAGKSAGTLTEIAHALKHPEIPLCVINYTKEMKEYLLQFPRPAGSKIVFTNDLGDIREFIQSV